MTKTPEHPGPEQLAARLQAARSAGAPGIPERLRLQRALAEEYPAYMPNLLELARQLQLTDEPVPIACEPLMEVE